MTHAKGVGAPTRRSRGKRVVIATDLLAQACEWRLLGLLLSRPTAETRQTARQLAGEVRDAALAALGREWSDCADEGAYLALLGSGGVVSPRVVAYRGFADPGWMLADIARYYEAFGFHPQTEEPPDHAASLLELVSYLWLKEAYAREIGADGAAEQTRAARDQFVLDYVAPLAAPMAERLDQCGAIAWAAAAHLLAARVPAPPPVVPGIGDHEDFVRCGGCAMAGEEPPP